MKHWMICLGALLLIGTMFGMPFTGNDAADLQPVELLQVSLTSDGVRVETETGDVGEGENLERAFEEMKRTTPGTVFLETAEFLLISDGARELIPELTSMLRPGCAVCLVTEMPDLKKAAEFLNIHRPELNLNDCRAGELKLPHLLIEEGRLKLEES